ncbi:MAG: C1 family peptidase [Marinifilaceae bacterium]|nr:C1 family peptidase [Marinifilaceae bacterium]
MKKLFLLMLLFLGAIANLIAQDSKDKGNRYGLIEINDSNRSKANEAKLKIPHASFGSVIEVNGKLKSGDAPLPKFFNNAKRKYMPPIINQFSGSCGLASNLHYIFSYEVNRKYNKDGKDRNNIYDYIATWNFMNKGTDGGTFPWDVFNLLKVMGGIPITLSAITDLYGPYSSTDPAHIRKAHEWPSGFNKYKASFNYKVKSYKYLDSQIPEDFIKMKEYVVNHGNDGYEGGGFIQFSAYADPLEATPYNGPSNTGYKAIIPMFGTKGMHSMTIVGYDDDIWYDYNGNKEKDADELGAFICVNSWGIDWGDKGMYYAPYKLFTTLKQGKGGTGNGGTECYMIDVVESSPKLAFYMKVSSDSRNDLSFKVGYSSDIKSDQADPATEQIFYPMNYAGGDFSMLGSSASKDKQASSLEFGIDLTQYAKEIPSTGKVAFFVSTYPRKIGDFFGTSKLENSLLIDIEKDSAFSGETYTRFGVTKDYKLYTTSITKIIYDKSKVSNDPTKDLNGGQFSITQDGANVNIFCNLRIDVLLSADIIDAKGNIVKPAESFFINKEMKAGWTNLTSSIAGLKGVYTVRIFTDNQVYTKTIEFK